MAWLSVLMDFQILLFIVVVAIIMMLDNIKASITILGLFIADMIIVFVVLGTFMEYEPTALDVYRGKTELKITQGDTTEEKDSTVVFQEPMAIKKQ